MKEAIIVYHEGRHYVVARWGQADLMLARTAFEARDQSQPEYDDRERERISEIRRAVHSGHYKLIEIESYEAG